MLRRRVFRPHQIGVRVEADAARAAPGLTGNGCVGEYHSVGTSPFGTGRSSTGISGLPLSRLSTKK